MSRCPECGSWGVVCGSDTPVVGCGCARCANATLDARDAEIAALKVEVEQCKRWRAALEVTENYENAALKAEVDRLEGFLEARTIERDTAKACLMEVAGERDSWAKGCRDWEARAFATERARDEAVAALAEGKRLGAKMIASTEAALNHAEATVAVANMRVQAVEALRDIAVSALRRVCADHGNACACAGCRVAFAKG